MTVDSALSNSSSNPVQNKVIKSALDTMNSNFQAGCNSIVQAVTAKGATPASNSPSDIASAIGSLNTSGGDTEHGAISIGTFNSMTEAQLLALSSGKNYYGTDIDSTDTATRSITVNGVAQTFTFSVTDKYSCYINKVSASEIISKTTITFDELKAMLDYSDRSVMVGKLVTGLGNSLYSGSYRIIGYDHNGSSHTYDLITEDCVQEASNGFGSSNRHYNDAGCYARIFAEETFYNAFPADVKSNIKPMEVEYRYSTSTSAGSTGTLQTNTAYGKLLSYNEAGTTYASTTSQGDKYKYADAGSEGNKYPYFNATGSALSNLRIKKYNGAAVNWWLRSRSTNGTNYVGRIYTDGGAGYGTYDSTSIYLAPVLRIG